MCFFLWLADAVCFFLWLADAMCFFDCFVTFVVSSFATLAPGVEGLPVFEYCANAGEATSSAVIIIPGTVNFM